MPSAEWTVQAPEQADQHGAAASEIVESDLAVVGDSVEHNLGRPVAWSKRSVVLVFRHSGLIHLLIEKRQDDQ
jgi:hypothetical protein